MSSEEIIKHRREKAREYHNLHRDELNRKKREQWWAKHDKFLGQLRASKARRKAGRYAKDELKECTVCGIGLARGFNWRETSTLRRCNTCDSGYHHNYYINNVKGNPEKELIKKGRQLEAAAKLKNDVIKAYSPDMRCQNPLCEAPNGASNIHALTIDHINGKGNEHRRQLAGANMYRWLKRHGYPSGYQVLCMSCQYIKRYNRAEWAKGRPAFLLKGEEILKYPQTDRLKYISYDT